MAAARAPGKPDVNRVLADITGALVGHFKMNTLLDQVVQMSMATLHASVCSIFLEDKQRLPGYLTMRAGSGFAEKLVNRSEYQIGEGFTGTVAKYGQGFNIKSRAELETLEVDGKRVWKGKFDNEQWPSGHSEFRNCIALPLKIKGSILGVIKVENKLRAYGDFFTEEEESYFEVIANVVALAIENARLHEQIETQLKTIAAKAAHRIHNHVANYDGIEMKLTGQARMPIPDKQVLEEIVVRISDTTRDLKRMVNEFKSYGKPLVIEKQPCLVNEIVRNEVWLAKPPLNIRIETRLDEDLPPIHLDTARFAEAMKELLRNSIKALQTRRDPGTIVVSTAIADIPAEAQPTGQGAKVVVTISDDGPGFPPDFPIFEPFQSTDPQSTGLGLATVKELVEAHGGQIEALQQESGGARIEIRLPA